MLASITFRVKFDTGYSLMPLIYEMLDYKFLLDFLMIYVIYVISFLWMQKFGMQQI